MSPERPEPIEPGLGWDNWRRKWPPAARVSYLTNTMTRDELVRRLLTTDDLSKLVDDPWRELDTSARLTKPEIAAVIVAMSSPNQPLP